MKIIQHGSMSLIKVPAPFTGAAKRLLAAFATTLLVVISGSTGADDTDLYTGLNNTPKVLFVLDVSGSMGRYDVGHSGTRLDRLKQALTSLMSNLNGIDVGLMSYSGRAIRLLHEVTDVSQERAELISIVNGLRAGGGTPTVSAMHEASLYFQGRAPRAGRTLDGRSTYQTPITSECESSHVVLLTDGRPYSDTTIQGEIQSQYGFSCTAEPSYRSATCGVELADYLVNNNQIPSIPDSSITTHSIGFNLDYDWVERVANAGDGIYADANSAQDLIDAFNEILNSVEIESAGSAPTISVNAFNESRHSDKLYYNFFQPYRGPRWDGNVKKYRISEGEIVDKNNNPVFDASGIVLPSSQSLWADSDDGAEVSDGGMAARQPAGRNWYTDVGVTPSNGVITPFRVTRTDQLRASDFGAANGTERDRLVNWVRGFDLADPSQPNNFVADSLHSSPTLVTYRANESSGLLEEVIFVANNMGVLHAVDAKTGEELWSYSPEELLPNVKGYLDNLSANHIYGLDGSIVAHTVEKSNSSLDYELDEGWLYLTQRRGGSNMFALDITDAMRPSNPLRVMWKINGGIAGTDFQDMAQTWATPQLIPVRYGCPTNCEVKNVLMFGGGYNPIYDDENIAFPVTRPANGHGNAIYLVDPETGELIWSAGNGSHHDLDLPMNDSIPTTPVPVDTNADGVVDTLFVSDIAGYIWRVDLNSEATDADDLAIGGGAIASLNGPGQNSRFFNRVDVVINGTTEGTAFYSIVAGTGMRSSPLYDEPVDNRLFVIKDPWVFSSALSDNVDPTTGKRLPRYEYVENSNNTYSIIGPRDLWQHGTAETANSRQYGYFKLFSEMGEKILQPTLTHSGRVFVVSYVPPDPATRYDSCTYNVGESRLHILDLADGSNGLASTYGNYLVVGSGIISIGNLFDNGDSAGAGYLSSKGFESVEDLFAPADPNVFRRFIRTGWLEKDDH
jgi:type IV pilus assembly protein PilY1